MRIPPTKILAFDPGSTCTGWASCLFRKESLQMQVIKYGHFSPTDLARKFHKDECKKYTQQNISLEVLETEVTNLLNIYEPNYVVSEDAFFKFGRVNAYISLKLNIHTISRMCRLKNLVLCKLAPRDIKKTISGTGNADKNVVQESVFNNEHIRFKGNKKTIENNLIEHEADAIAVAWTLCNNVLAFSGL